MLIQRPSAVFLALALSLTAAAEIEPERGAVARLPARPSAHWLWVNDVVFDHMEAGKAYLIDGDSGRFLGMLSTGFNNMVLAMPSDYSAIYAAEVYLSRGTRGARTDIIAIYDPITLSPISEIEIPPKRAQSNPTFGHVGLTDDDRFLLVYNFTPAQSVTVVDVDAGRFVTEIETPGCALAYACGKRHFFSMCGDGALLLVELDDNGVKARVHRTAPFFEWNGDFVTERPVRVGDTWLFFSVNANVYPVDLSGGEPKFLDRWSLVDAAQAGWTIGGLQAAAVHQVNGRLYTLMHRGDAGTRKDPGSEVWVYDLAGRTRVQRFALEDLASAIQVSQDRAPLLYAMFIESRVLDVYDAVSGKHLRRTARIGHTPTMLQTTPLR
jgi:methylamine dehydrogenase heavy chain